VFAVASVRLAEAWGVVGWLQSRWCCFVVRCERQNAKSKSIFLLGTFHFKIFDAVAPSSEGTPLSYQPLPLPPSSFPMMTVDASNAIKMTTE
jgi:hypothetical protein